MEIMPEITYTFHIREHQVDIRVDGEGVCFPANVEDDDPKVNPAKVLHARLSVWCAGSWVVMLHCGPLALIYTSAGWNRWAESHAYSVVFPLDDCWNFFS